MCLVFILMFVHLFSCMCVCVCLCVYIFGVSHPKYFDMAGKQAKLNYHNYRTSNECVCCLVKAASELVFEFTTIRFWGVLAFKISTLHCESIRFPIFRMLESTTSKMCWCINLIALSYSQQRRKSIQKSFFIKFEHTVYTGVRMPIFIPFVYLQILQWSWHMFKMLFELCNMQWT